jgi:hypothetical protein
VLDLGVEGISSSDPSISGRTPEVGLERRCEACGRGGVRNTSCPEPWCCWLTIDRVSAIDGLATVRLPCGGASEDVLDQRFWLGVVATDTRSAGPEGVTGEPSSSLTIDDGLFGSTTALVECSSSLGAVVPSSSWIAFVVSSSILGMIRVAKGSMRSGGRYTVVVQDCLYLRYRRRI